jgi:hypothetical protein
MTNTQKLGIFLFTIIAAAVIVSLATNPAQPDDTQNATTTPATSSEQADIPNDWQSYENAQLNVSASHPPNATVQTEGPENRHIKFTYLGEDNATGEITDGFTLTISNYDKPASTPLRAFVESLVDDNTPAQNTSAIATTTFRNNTALEYTTETLGTFNHLAFSPSNDRVVTISSNVSDPNDNDYDQLVDQIIASAEFSQISADDSEPAGTVSQVTLMMLDREVPDGEEPERGCDLLAPITRDIEPTQAPLTAAMEELFAINRTNVQGFYNFLANTNDTLSFDQAAVTNGTANIYLTGELTGLAGVCDNPRAAIQIEETARQFSTVEDVQIYLNDEPTDLMPSGR